MSLFEELKRRNVFRVAVAYLVTAWLLLQVTDQVLENIGAPDWIMHSIMLLLAIGFPLAVILACGFDQWTHLLGASHGEPMKAYEFYQRGTRCNAVDESQWTHSGYAAVYANRPDLTPRAHEGASEKPAHPSSWIA